MQQRHRDEAVDPMTRPTKARPGTGARPVRLTHDRDSRRIPAPGQLLTAGVRSWSEPCMPRESGAPAGALSGWHRSRAGLHHADLEQEAWSLRCSLGRARRARPWAHHLCTIVLEPRAERRV